MKIQHAVRSPSSTFSSPPSRSVHRRLAPCGRPLRAPACEDSRAAARPPEAALPMMHFISCSSQGPQLMWTFRLARSQRPLWKTALSTHYRAWRTEIRTARCDRTTDTCTPAQRLHDAPVRSNSALNRWPHTREERLHIRGRGQAVGPEPWLFHNQGTTGSHSRPCTHAPIDDPQHVLFSPSANETLSVDDVAESGSRRAARLQRHRVLGSSSETTSRQRRRAPDRPGPPRGTSRAAQGPPATVATRARGRPAAQREGCQRYPCT